VLGEGTPRAADALLAFGEILSSRIVGAAFAEQGLRVAQVDARRVMITDARHGAAEPDLDEVAARGAELIARVSPRRRFPSGRSSAPPGRPDDHAGARGRIRRPQFWSASRRDRDLTDV
jgi:hypothetical protein